MDETEKICPPCELTVNYQGSPGGASALHMGPQREAKQQSEPLICRNNPPMAFRNKLGGFAAVMESSNSGCTV